MSAIEGFIKEIASEIHQLGEGEFGEALLDDLPEDFLPSECYLEPCVDVLVKPRDPREIAERVAHPTILGLYVLMQSPGQIILVARNIRAFFWSLVQSIHPRAPYMTKLDLLAALRLVVMRTHEHELFHYYCDVVREMFTARYEPLTEEALAVAWARSCIVEQRSQWNSQIGRLNNLVYSLLMEQAFAYRSPGYRDWENYADEVRFKQALLAYLPPGNCSKLQVNGVNLQDLVYGMFGDITGGNIERVV